MTNCDCKTEADCQLKKRGHLFEICRGTATLANGEKITTELSLKYREMWTAMAASPHPNMATINVEAIPGTGVGSEVSSLCNRIGIPTCGGCGGKAAEWNRNGIDWCESNKSVLVGWLSAQSTEFNVSLASAAANLAIEEPVLAATIAGVKFWHPFTELSEIAASCIVDFAIDKARERESPPVDNADEANQKIIVINSNRHGFGDACVMAWVSEGSRNASVKLVHHAAGAKKAFLELLGQEVVERKSKMIDTFRAYSKELADRGNPPRLWHRSRFIGITAEPVRPRHTLTPDEITEGRQAVGENAVLLWANTDYGSREWPPVYWLELAGLLKQSGYSPFFCGGRTDARYSAWPGIWGQSWRKNAAVMLAAKLVVGNDSGPAHLAGTLDVPTIALLGPTTDSVFVQYRSVHCMAASKEEISCSGCYFHAPFSKPCERGCAALCHITPARVLAESRRMIGV